MIMKELKLQTRSRIRIELDSGDVTAFFKIKFQGNNVERGDFSLIPPIMEEGYITVQYNMKNGKACGPVDASNEYLKKIPPICPASYMNSIFQN